MTRLCPQCQALTPMQPGVRWFCDGCGMNDANHDAPRIRKVICDCGRLCFTLPGVPDRCKRCNALVSDGVCELNTAPKVGTSVCIPDGTQLYQIDEYSDWNLTERVLPHEFTVRAVEYGFVMLDRDGLAVLAADWDVGWEQEIEAGRTERHVCPAEPREWLSREAAKSGVTARRDGQSLSSPKAEAAN